MKTFNHVGLEPIEMVARTTEGERLYLTPTGNRYPSVTTVIGNNSKKKAAIAKWRKRVGSEEANRISSRATGRGDKVHKLYEYYINNELTTDILGEDVQSKYMFNNSRHVIDRINNVYLQEAALYSDILKIAGRVDCIAEYNGVLSIIDFKTSAKPKRESYLYDYYVQEAAYAVMLRECYDMTVKQLVTIIACENGDTQVQVVEPKREYFLKLYEYIQEYRNTYDPKTGG